jgi:flagellar biosynthesis/type III secretory pathway ATPase
LVDRALALWPQVESFLRQPVAEVSPLAETWQRLQALAAQQ